MSSPLVTVICLCYNHDRFVEEAIQSVIHQLYPNIQLIVMDDASTDNSTFVIEKIIANHPEIIFIKNDKNLGNCTAFNNALSKAEGEYIIDLAADDVLLPNRIVEGVNSFLECSNEYGVNFTDAEVISEKGEHIEFHHTIDKLHKLNIEVPQGDLFELILKKYFICPPTVMVKKEVFQQLSGYDESLAYEDYDFWVRSSRNWKYCFTNKVLVQKREVKNSLGKNQYKRHSNQMYSTYLVCQKALQLCNTRTEFKALRKRIYYEVKHALWFLDYKLTYKYYLLWFKSIFH